jgi:hypothetical protein
MEEKRGEYRVLVGKPDGKSSVGRSSRRWEDILIWICKNGVGTDWIDLVQDRDR